MNFLEKKITFCFFPGKNTDRISQMKPGKSIQTKLLVSVFVIVSITILCITALMAYLEKDQLNQMELNRLFYETQSIKKRLGHLTYSTNWRQIMLTLSNSMHRDSSMLYFLLTDNNGSILICDNENFIGKSAFEIASLKDVNSPVATDQSFEGKMDHKPYFSAFLSKMNQDLYRDEELKAEKNDVIFDTFWDIRYMGEKLGALRIAFSIRLLRCFLRDLSVLWQRCL